jgi:dienelactone hydrolase
MIITEEKKYSHGDVELKGLIAKNADDTGMRPGVMIIHDWSGCNESAKEQARLLAAKGYVAFAIDMYGDGRVGQTNEEKEKLMQPLVSNRVLLRERVELALTTFTQTPEVNANAIAVIGFCFGGLCALDLARTGADIQGVVSFHGLLNADTHFKTKSIKAKVLVLHGYDDPMVTPKSVNEFCEEMTKAKADWQVLMFGNTSHAFTNPLANDPNLGTIYNPLTSRRAFAQMHTFFEEIF